MHTLPVQVRGLLIPELRVNGARVYLDPVNNPDLDPDPIDERDEVRIPRRRRRYRRSLTRWNP